MMIRNWMYFHQLSTNIHMGLKLRAFETRRTSISRILDPMGVSIMGLIIIIYEKLE